MGLFLQAAKEGKVPKGSVLLVEAFDRLTRSPPLVAVNLLSDIVRAGITIVTIRDKKAYTEESLNTNLADLMMSVVLLMAAHEEVKHRAARVRDDYTGVTPACRLSARPRQGGCGSCPIWQVGNSSRNVPKASGKFSSWPPLA